MKVPAGHKEVVAIRPFYGRNGRLVQPGESEILHDSAARAAHFRGDARFADAPEPKKQTKALSGPSNTGAPQPVKLSASDQILIAKGKKRDILNRLDELGSGEDFSMKNSSAELRAGLAKALGA